MDYRKLILIACIFGGTSVILGAFGAHALKDVLSETQLSSYKTGNTYQFYHSLLLLGIGVLVKSEKSKWLNYAAWMCILGIICFSGSLYLLSCKDILGINNTMIIGPITPIGGLLFTLSWLFLGLNFIKKK